MDLRLLLRVWKRFGDDDALAHGRAARSTAWPRGGIYDHLGGGFHRYSTDARWLVPHFEKMLYDNALLSRRLPGGVPGDRRAVLPRVVEETLDYVLREMTSPDGPFYSTQDADSEGEEGKFFVWSRGRGRAPCSARSEAELFCSVYDVTPEGNWEGHNILHRTQDRRAGREAAED